MLSFVLMWSLPVQATLTIDPGHVLAVAPRDLNGLSYEAMQLTDPGFFSADNRQLVAMFRRLSAHGVLRIGGNSSELSWWQPSPESTAPAEVLAQAGRTGAWTNRTPYAITPKAIDNLAGFLKATGWTMIYGLNFGAGTPERDAEEADYVAKRLGNHLKYFQIGNEPDLYTTGDNGGRPKGWGFENYAQEWLAIADAVSEKVPGARFGGPDVAGNSNWIVRFGEEVGPKLGKRLASLSGHYYAMGPAGAKTSDIAHMLSPAKGVAQALDRIRPVATRLGVTYRMTEGNSCYRGGQAGVSNALAAAIWAGDYTLDLLAHGGGGVNFHGGSSAQIAASLGNHLPGARNDADVEIAKLGTFYSPIAGSRDAGFTARPMLYGMYLAEQFAGKQMVEARLGATDANLTSYAARDGGGYLVAVFNKDLAKDATVALTGVPFKSAAVWRLTAPSLDSTTGVTFGGGVLTADAPFLSVGAERISVPTVNVPHGSAVLMWIKR
jgi:hypothetical protein